MSGTTTNNGWTYPTSTDYVKDGATAIQTLATGIDTSTGKGLIAWQAWTPTMTGWTGAGTWSNTYYCQLGKTVTVTGKFTPSSTTGIGAVTINLPVTARYAMVSAQSSFATAGGASYITACRLSSTTQFVVFAVNAAGTYLVPANFSSSAPGTWAATGDQFTFQFTYEAA